MEWLQSNWIWFAVVFGFIAMNFFGHGATITGVPAMVKVTRSRTPVAPILRMMALRPVGAIYWRQRPLAPFKCRDFR